MKEFNIYFEYKEQKIKIPSNPEELRITTPSENESEEVVGLGEVSIIKDIGLIPIALESYIHESEEPDKFLKFIKQVQKDKKPMRIICKDFELNLLVSIVNFEWWISAGEEEYRYFNLELQEYRDYSPIVLTKEQPKTSEGQGKGKEKTKEVAEENKKEVQKGSIVKFNGGPHYHSSQDEKPTGKPRTSGNAKLTLKAPGSKHPYHLIGMPGGSDVYGWVDEGSFTT